MVYLCVRSYFLSSLSSCWVCQAPPRPSRGVCAVTASAAVSGVSSERARSGVHHLPKRDRVPMCLNTRWSREMVGGAPTGATYESIGTV